MMRSIFPEIIQPPHYNPDKVGEVWRVPYEKRAQIAYAWAKEHNLPPAGEDRIKVNLIIIDVQNTFCIPDFELFVAGRSGLGAVEDNRRLCEFIYRNLGNITQITPTLDTHQATQIFHANFLLNDEGEHPSPYSQITMAEISSGSWRFNPAIASSLGIHPQDGQKILEHYIETLTKTGKFDLTIWPYHAMLGGIGHAMVSAVEDAIFFHTISRNSQPDFEIKGRNPFTEHYSAIGPEVLTGPEGIPLGEKSKQFFQKVLDFDAVLIAGQAKSHCVAWTVADLLADILAFDPTLANKVYLLEDCTSPVVVPGADFSDQADAAFYRFSSEGMNIVKSTDPIDTWPDLR